MYKRKPNIWRRSQRIQRDAWHFHDDKLCKDYINEGNIIDNRAEIVELFDYFEDIYEKDEESIDFDEFANVKELNLTMFDIEITD